MKKGWRIAFIVLLVVCLGLDILFLIDRMDYFLSKIDYASNTDPMFYAYFLLTNIFCIAYYVLNLIAAVIMIIVVLTQFSKISYMFGALIARVQLIKEEIRAKAHEEKKQRKQEQIEALQEQIEALQEQLNNEETE